MTPAYCGNCGWRKDRRCKNSRSVRKIVDRSTQPCGHWATRDEVIAAQAAVMVGIQPDVHEAIIAMRRAQR